MLWKKKLLGVTKCLRTVFEVPIQLRDFYENTMIQFCGVKKKFMKFRKKKCSDRK